ncbi:hypothetical protein KUIN1_35150 [Pseudomonas sp. KUIN-1]|nr:hypothetical protein KUIN1_35150 [Pseudomonas sp. KUIN-1]
MRTVRRPGKLLQVASLSAKHRVELEATTDEQRNHEETGEHTGGDIRSDTHGLCISRKQKVGNDSHDSQDQK